MPPTIAQTAEDVYDAIAASPVAGMLGTLRVDGDDVPALMVVSDGEPVAGLDGAAGVALMISRDQSTRSEPTYSGGYLVHSFTVRALQFGNPPHRLREVSEGLAGLFPGARVSSLGGPAPLAGHGQLAATLTGPVVVDSGWTPSGTP
jgi:hypothetical protein